MALIKCSECGKEISSNAPACPNCGNPIAVAPQQNVIYVKEATTTIQETSKELKKRLVWSGLMMLGGLFIMIIAGASQSTGMMSPGALLIVIGLGWQIVTRCKIWWHHK